MDINILSLIIFMIVILYFYHNVYFIEITKSNSVNVALFTVSFVYYLFFDNYLCAIILQIIIGLIYCKISQKNVQILDCIFMILLISFLKLLSFVMVDLLMNSISYYVLFPDFYVVILRDLLFGFASFYSIKPFKHYLLKAKEYSIVYEIFHIILIFIYIIYLIIILMKREVAFLTFIELVLITIFVMAIYKLIEKIQYIEKENYTMKLYNEELKLNQKNFEQISSSITEMKKVKHDMNHFLLMLMNYCNNEEYEQIKNNLQSQLNLVNQPNYNVSTGNNSMDLIISSRLPLMKKEGIEFITSSLNDTIYIDMLDFYTLMGNVLDNAIENCTSQSIKKILLDIYIENERIYIDIKNTSLNNPLNGEQRFKTTKTDSENHGLGMTTIESIVQKYEGNITYHYSLNYFSINICMNNKNSL